MIVKTGPNHYVNLSTCCNFSLNHNTSSESRYTRFCVTLDVVHDNEAYMDNFCDVADYLVGGESVSEEWFEFVLEKFEFALEYGHPYFNAYKYMEAGLTDEEVYELVTGKKITEKELAALNDDSSKNRVKLRLVKEGEDDKG